MRRLFARAGVGLMVLTATAAAETPPHSAAEARTTALERLHARLVAERAEAQELGRQLAIAPLIRHARAARAE